MDDMLQKAHLVIEGTFIYLRDSTEFFIRVRDGWKKLQVILVLPITNCLQIPSEKNNLLLYMPFFCAENWQFLVDVSF